MKIGKPKSKRTPVRLRHKIEKASAAKQRKQRKEAKQNPQWRSRLKKDPGIPNLFPYKDKVLAEIEENKRRKSEEQQRKRDLAKAQRTGKRAESSEAVRALDEDEDEELADADEGVEPASEDEDMEEDANPMAALLASAQARARTFQPNDAGVNGEDDDNDDDDDNDEEDFTGFGTTRTHEAASSSRSKALPKTVLDDPVKAVSVLVERLEKTSDGMAQLLGYYQLPPLVTAGSNTTTRLLVDVARKRGRLGRGGIPNLNAAALTVLGDLNEERMKLPALTSKPKALNAGEVEIVSQLSEPFRIEGLFEPESRTSNMQVEA